MLSLHSDNGLRDMGIEAVYIVLTALEADSQHEQIAESY